MEQLRIYTLIDKETTEHYFTERLHFPYLSNIQRLNKRTIYCPFLIQAFRIN
jgi:hypothetical protein